MFKISTILKYEPKEKGNPGYPISRRPDKLYKKFWEELIAYVP
jgi:hypothetical protein